MNGKRKIFVVSFPEENRDVGKCWKIREICVVSCESVRNKENKFDFDRSQSGATCCKKRNLKISVDDKRRNVYCEWPCITVEAHIAPRKIPQSSNSYAKSVTTGAERLIRCDRADKLQLGQQRTLSMFDNSKIDLGANRANPQFQQPHRKNKNPENAQTPPFFFFLIDS